jgi:hypothetical protein
MKKELAFMEGAGSHPGKRGVAGRDDPVLY